MLLPSGKGTSATSNMLIFCKWTHLMNDNKIVDLETPDCDSCVIDVPNVSVKAGKFAFRKGNVKEKMSQK